MAQYANFLSVPTDQFDDSGYEKIFTQVLKGMQMANAPKQMKQQQEMADAQIEDKRLANQMASYNLQPENLDLNRQYKEAQIQQMMAPPPVKKPEIQQAIEYAQSLPEGSEARKQADMFIKKLTTRGQRTVYDSSGNPILTEGGSFGLPALKRGESYSYQTDEKGNPILDQEGEKVPNGINVPLTEKEVQEETGRYMLNKLYPQINNIMSHYAGQGSNVRFLQDVDAAKKGDKEAVNRLKDLYTAQKLITPVAAKEQKTLQASGTLGALKYLQDSIDSSEIAPLAKTIASFQVPNEIIRDAGNNWLNLVTTTTSEANKRIPAFRTRPFPGFEPKEKGDKPKESSAQAPKPSQDLSQWQSLPATAMVQITDDSGNSKTVTVEEAKKMGAM